MIRYLFDIVRTHPAFGILTVLAALSVAPVAVAQEPGTQASTLATHVRPALGAVTGVVRGSAKTAISGAMITAVKADGQGVWTTISGNDGIYSIPNVAAGDYSITAQADGYPDGVIASVQVPAGRAIRVDIAIGGANDPVTISSNPGGARTPPNDTRSTMTANTNSSGNLLRRLVKDVTVTSEPVPIASLTLPPAGAMGKPVMDIQEPNSPKPNTPNTPPPAPVAPVFPEALQAPEPVVGVDNFTPFAYADFTWLNGTPRTKDTVLDTKFFTPEVRFDTHFMEDFNQPHDHTIVGATESFRSGEIQIEQASVGGDFHWQNVRGRILFMEGLFATTTPRNDASSGNLGGVGQWDLQNAYKYVSEAWGGYHFNVQHGLNVDAGIFVSYIGLFSYYNFDNWTYQPSYVSSNTPWFFNGVRIQWFPTNKLKIEPWIVNGWQSYAKFNGHLGLGGQLLWMPKEWFKLVANQYGYGQDNLGLPHTQRIHTDDSIEVRYYNNQNNGSGVSKMAFSLTGDLGCQYGGGLNCTHGPNQSAFLGWMLYDRTWFHHDLFAVTVGGGQMSNPGRYLTLLPPIDGANATQGTPYFTENPGQKAHMYDGTITFQYMPRQYITWWGEVGYRHADIPYFAGRGGVTPPGGNNGLSQYYTCMSGASALTNDLSTAQATCASGGSSVWFPDLRHSETKISVGVMVKF